MELVMTREMLDLAVAIVTRNATTKKRATARDP
jgi:hypothetical protein